MRHSLVALLGITLAVAQGCASAGKRLEQGAEAQARGDWGEAASRYLDALEKDPTLASARDALLVAWDSVSERGLARAEGLSPDAPVAAAQEFLVLDGLRGRAAGLGVTLQVPDGYTGLRRGALDRAIDDLHRQAEILRGQERWEEARGRYRRARSDFDPSPLQRRESLEAEADLLLDWSGADALEGRFRASYAHAEEALGLSGQLPDAMVESAADLKERALARGVRVLAVFPLETTSEAQEDLLPELEAQLTDALDADHWRRPPYFLAVVDPAHARRIVRRISPAGTALRPQRILDELGADFGALIQITRTTVVEEDLKAREVTARTRDGRRATYRIEEGRARHTVHAEVTLFDAAGREMDRFGSEASRSARFQRAVYGGDPQQLDLPRGERRLFDVAEQRAQRASAVAELVSALAEDLAGGVFERVVRRIP